MQKITYTIGVRRRFGFGTDLYKVHAHRLEILGDAGQLVLECTDGSEVHVPNVGRRAWRVYPDYQAEQQRLQALTAEVRNEAQRLAHDLDVQRHQAQLAQMNAAQRRMQAVGQTMGQVPVQG